MATPYPGYEYSVFTLEMLQRYPKTLRMQEPPEDPTPYSQRGLENPPGWEDLCRRFFAELDVLVQPYHDAPDSFQLAQLKSKYAGLRVYVERLPKDKELGDKLRALISKYEEEASRTCELDGKPGLRCTNQDRSWVRIACQDCRERHKLHALSDPAPVVTIKPTDLTAPTLDLRITT